MGLTNRPHQLWKYVLANWKMTPDESYWETVKVILEYDSVEQLNALLKGIECNDIIGMELITGITILHLAVDHLAEKCIAYILGWPNVRTGCPRSGFPAETCTSILTRMIDMTQPVPWGVQLFTNIFRMLSGFYKTDINHFSIGYTALHRCCLLYTSPSPRDLSTSRMPSSA